MLNSEDKAFWKGLGIRSFALFGFTFFSTLVGLQLNNIQSLGAVLYASFIGAGLYFFTELMIYHKIQPDKKVISKSQKNLYSFFI